ncbi:MAG: radical SAM protein, partial [Candidatus Sulfotelmatobacter sp.]
MSLMAEMNQKALKLGLPLSVHFDLTYRCNERCVHCYLDHDDHGEMTTAEITGVLTQLADAGVFFLSLSGGEVLLRRDFFEIVEHARKLLFNVKVKTNATMIHEKEAARLRELGVEQIQISVYSHRPEVHDAITKLPGSLDRTIRAIRFLKSQGLKVSISNVLMGGN